MKYENIFYMTSDKLLDIEFLLVDVGEEEGWRAYILTDIDYRMFSNSRSVDFMDIHRHNEVDENMIFLIRRFMQATRPYDCEDFEITYICWTKKMESLSELKKVVSAWSEITAYYIKHGSSFEKIHPKLKAKGIISI